MSKASSPAKRIAWPFFAVASALAITALVLSYYRLTKVPAISSFASLTTKLPVCDRIEIDADEGEETTILKVDGTRTFLEKDSQPFEKLWRAFDIRDGFGDLCHSPIYRFRFFVNGGLFSEATICFQCDNIYFIRDNGTAQAEELREVGFNADSVSAQNLRQYLSNLFPGHDPGPLKR